MGFLQRRRDVLGVPALDDERLIRLRLQKFLKRLQLLVAHELFGLGLGGSVQNGLGSVVLHLYQRIHQVAVGFLHLTTGQFMGHGLCAGFGFLPVVVAVTDEMGGRRIAELSGKVAGHDLGLTDVRIVLRLIAVGVVIGFRRDIPGLLPDAREEALGAVPDGVQLTVLQRRHTLCSLV